MEEKYLTYFDNFCVEDTDEVLTICQAAKKKIYNRIKMRFDDPKLLGTVFSIIYETIIEELKTLEESYSSFEINIAGKLLIGYSTNENTDDEKVGNFMIYMKNIGSNSAETDTVDPNLKSIELASRWNTENIVDQPELLRKISIKAIENLSKVADVKLSATELIMPIFVYTYESICQILIIKRKELDEFEHEINFMSCFYIGARETESDVDDIYIRPNIEAKLLLKDDAKASSKYE